MIKGVSHIGIGVKNLDEAKEFFKKTFNLECSETESFGELRHSLSLRSETHTSNCSNRPRLRE